MNLIARTLRLAAVGLVVAPMLAGPASAQRMHAAAPDYLGARADVNEISQLIRGRENHDARAEHNDEKSALGFLHGTVDHINAAATLDGLDLAAQPAPQTAGGSLADRVGTLFRDAQAKLHEPEHNWHALHERATAIEMLTQAEKRAAQAIQAAI